MIAMLYGIVAQKSPTHSILDVNGVGYSIQTPLSTFYSLPDVGQQAQLYIHTHVREDALHLFGFLTETEKELFILLLTISGVGPKLAVNILSNIAPDDFCTAVLQEDSKRLAALPGLGKKTSERLVLELKDKIGKMETLAPQGAAPIKISPATANTEDALGALINLGYKEKQAQKALDALEIEPETGLEEILKNALKVLTS